MTQSATREEVFSALFGLFDSNLTGVQSYSRRMTLPAQVLAGNGAGDMPTLMFWERPEDTSHSGDLMPPKREWEVWIVCVFQNQDKGVAGATILNPILEQVETIMLTDPNQTLGPPPNDLCYWARIEGDTIKETGDTDTNGLGGFVVPIKILMP